MRRHICILCRTLVLESGARDPSICINCERIVEDAEASERFAYLGNEW